MLQIFRGAGDGLVLSHEILVVVSHVQQVALDLLQVLLRGLHHTHGVCQLRLGSLQPYRSAVESILQLPAVRSQLGGGLLQVGDTGFGAVVVI